MKNYKESLVPKCYTRPLLNRPRRSKSHCVKVAERSWWKAVEAGLVK